MSKQNAAQGQHNASIGHMIAIASVVIGIPGAVLAWTELIEPRIDPSASTSTPPDDTAAPTSPPITVSPTTSPSTILDEGLDNCAITVDHIGAEINATPSHAAVSQGSVPTGSYAAGDTTISSWGGKDERWFEIDVNGRVGWIVDNGIFIVERSSGCP